MKKNTAGQFVTFEVKNSSTGARVTGDAANITPYYQIDSGALTGLGTTTITEWAIAKSGIGLYYMQPSQAETNGSNIMYLAISTTGNALCQPRFFDMYPPGFDTFLDGSGNGALASPVVVTQNNDKTGYSLSASGITAIWAATMEGAFTAIQYMRLFAAGILGKATGLDTNAPVYRDTGDTKNRITATTDANGNRSAVTLDGT